MDLLICILTAISKALINPPLIIVLVVLIIMLHLKNKKISMMQQMIVGGRVNSAIELTLSQFIFGIFGGVLGSIIITALGVNFSQDSGIQFIFVISILLMIIKPKYICFSYSAAVLGILSIVVRYFKLIIPQFKNISILNMNILYLIIFIAVMHIVEGILIIFDGDKGIVPIFTENEEGQILGGYAFNRYWVLPVTMIMSVIGNPIANSVNISIDMPSWWNLIQGYNGVTIVSSAIMVMVPFYAMIGYSTVTFTQTKRKKVISSGIHIISYGVLLIIVAQICRFGVVGEIISLILMPIGHEIMMKIQRKGEQNRNAKFVSDKNGVVILEVSNDSKFRKFGIEIGSKILSMNNIEISSEEQVYEILKENLYRVIIKVEDKLGNISEFKYIHEKDSRLGILMVPKKIEEENKIDIKKNSFKSVLEKVSSVNE